MSINILDVKVQKNTGVQVGYGNVSQKGTIFVRIGEVDEEGKTKEDIIIPAGKQLVLTPAVRKEGGSPFYNVFVGDPLPPQAKTETPAS